MDVVRGVRDNTDREWERLFSFPNGEWHRYALAMGWIEAQGDPSWMDEGQRAMFWRQVARGRQLAEAQVAMRELREAFLAPIERVALRVARLLSRWP